MFWYSSSTSFGSLFVCSFVRFVDDVFSFLSLFLLVPLAVNDVVFCWVGACACVPLKHMESSDIDSDRIMWQFTVTVTAIGNSIRWREYCNNNNNKTILNTWRTIKHLFIFRNVQRTHSLPSLQVKVLVHSAHCSSQRGTAPPWHSLCSAHNVQSTSIGGESERVSRIIVIASQNESFVWLRIEFFATRSRSSSTISLFPSRSIPLWPSTLHLFPCDSFHAFKF